MLAFKFSHPCADPFKPRAMAFPPANQLESFQYAPVFDSDDECATSLALDEKLRSFQYAPVFDSHDEAAASLAPPVQLESFQYAPVFDSNDECATSLVLPDQVESIKDAPVFNSDDEYVTEEDDSLSICNSLATEFSFRRRPIPVAPQNPVSLIALKLDAIRKDNIGFEVGEWEDSDWDNHSDGDYEPLKEANLAAGIVLGEELAASRPIVSEPIALGSHQAIQTVPDDITTCAQPTHKTSLVAFAKKAITNLKWRGGNITRLCTKPKDKQHTAVVATRNQDQVEADEEEEANPYEMFFGSGQDQGMRV